MTRNQPGPASARKPRSNVATRALGQASDLSPVSWRAAAGSQDRRSGGQGGYPCLRAYRHPEAGSSLGKKTGQGGPPADHIPGAAGQRPPKALVSERGRKPPGVVVEGGDESQSDDRL